MNIKEFIDIFLYELTQEYLEDIKNEINRQDFLVFSQYISKMGKDIYYPSLLLFYRSGAKFSDKSIERLLNIKFLDISFKKIVDNKKYFLRESLINIRHFIRDILKIQEYEFSYKLIGGDSHNLGKESVFFEIYSLNCRYSFIYKPTNSFSQDIHNSLMSYVCKTIGITENPIQAIVYSSKNFYIKRYIEESKINSVDEWNKYLYFMGILLAVILVLKEYDLHYENIVCSKSMPIVIDGEFLLNELDNPRDVLDQSGLLNYFYSSLYGISTFKKVEFDIEKDNLRFTKDSFYRKHILFDGKLKFALDKYNIKFIKEGFKDAINSFYSLRGSKDFFANKIDINSCLRFLTRPTAFYKIMQMYMWTPIPLSVEGRIKKIKSKLSSKYIQNINDDRIYKNIINLETKDLMSGDIPFFWINYEGSLMHHTDKVIDRYNIYLMDRIEEIFDKKYLSTLNVGIVDYLYEQLAANNKF